MPTERVTKKVVLSGDIVEVYEYEYGYLQGFTKSPKGLNFDCEGSDGDSRERSLQRARSTLRRLINANAGHFDKFVTLTFAENEMDLDFCNYEFNKFIKRLKYQLKRDLKYVAVVEFQKRGAVHYHLLCNLGYVSNKVLREIWGHGFVKINRIKDVSNLGAYVCKYMQKDFADKRLEGRKCFFGSKGLNRPVEITAEKEANQLEASLLQSLVPVFSSEFENEFTGKVTYRQYNLKAVEVEPALGQ